MPIDQHHHAPAGHLTLSRRPVYVPIDRIVHAPIPHEDDMDPDWRLEHEAEYAQFGGSAGYVTWLASSLRDEGQDEWVELRLNGDGSDGTYDIQDGNHRVAAAEAAGLSHVLALIRYDPRAASAVLSLRVPLTSLITTEDAMRDTLASGRCSETPDEPSLLNVRDDGLGFEIADGHHRIAAAIRRGEDAISAEIDLQPDPDPYQPPFYDFARH